MTKYINRVLYLYDIIEVRLHGKNSDKYFSLFFLGIFLTTLFLIQFNITFGLPRFLGSFVPKNHMYAIDMVLSLILLKEILDMIFAITYSVTNAQRKQLEVLSLILLRLAFKEIPEFQQLNHMSLNAGHPVVHLISYGLSSFIVFLIIILFYRLPNLAILPEENEIYIDTKKIIALVLFISFVVIGVYDMLLFLKTLNYRASFSTFFKVFLFAEIFIVLISFGQSQLYVMVYRNTGYALATVLILIALVSPQFYQEVISIIAALFAYSLAYFYNRYCVHCNIDLRKEHS